MSVMTIQNAIKNQIATQAIDRDLMNHGLESFKS